MPYHGNLKPERRREDYKTISIVSQGQTHSTYQAHKVPPGWRQNPKDYLLNAKHRSHWFIKAAHNPVEAQRERLAQELFRILAIGQPKTRIAKETFSDRVHRLYERYWVASKGVKGFVSFKNYYKNHHNTYSGLITKLLSGAVYGLGHLLVAALWVNEIDGHEGNYGIDESGRVIKIDGDECFARITSELAPLTGKALITTRDLKTLPFIQDYGTCNWLDIIFHQQWVNGSAFSDPALQKNEKIRQEVFEGILNVISMPDVFLDHITKAYIDNPHELQLLSKELKDRKKMLADAAFGIPEFVQYLKTPAAQLCFQNQLAYLKKFHVRSKQHLWDPAFQEHFEAAFVALQQRSAGPGVAVAMNRPQPVVTPIVQPVPAVQYFGVRQPQPIMRQHSVLQPPVMNEQPVRRHSLVTTPALPLRPGFIMARY